MAVTQLPEIATGATRPRNDRGGSPHNDKKRGSPRNGRKEGQ